MCFIDYSDYIRSTWFDRPGGYYRENVDAETMAIADKMGRYFVGRFTRRMGRISKIII